MLVAINFFKAGQFVQPKAEHLIIDSAHAAKFMPEPDKLNLRADEIKLWLTPSAKQIGV